MQLRTMFQRLCALLLLLCSAAAFANLREGVDHQRFSTTTACRRCKTVEVLEFFSYTRGHCYRLEPLLEQWKTLPKDVSFRRASGGKKYGADGAPVCEFTQQQRISAFTLVGVPRFMQLI